MLAPLLALVLSSPTFAPNATVPRTMVAKDCGGANVSPALRWSDVPKGTRSFALIVHDPDAPVPGGFYHWAIDAIPATASSLPAGTAAYRGYYGPCPPAGMPHHYHFTLYALDLPPAKSAVPLDARRLLARIKGHVLASASLTGLYATSPR